MPLRKSKPITYHRARNFRRIPTLAEAKLWSYLRTHQLHNIHFRRQHPIGKYVVDFCAPRQKLIIELDGSQHLNNQEYDAERNLFLTVRGYTVLRFWNSDITNNMDGVILTIEQALYKNSDNDLPPPTSPI